MSKARTAKMSQPTPNVPQRPKTVTLSTDLVDAMGNYMANRPWGEVQGLLGALQRELATQAKPAEKEPQ